MSSTINELASRLQLSKSSVSRILNNKGGTFSEETRQRVFALAAELNYLPHPVARALATGRTGFVALWIRDLVTSYHAHVAHVVDKHLERHGYHIVITLHEKSVSHAGASLPAAMGVDGVIAHEDYWAPFARPGVRVPVISTGVNYNPGNLDFVGIDLSAAAGEVVRHLLAPGRRRVAYLMHNLEWRGGDPRYEAYRSLMEAAGLPPEVIDPPAEDRGTVRRFVREYIRKNGCPEAIFCHSDDVAIAAYRALCDLGIRVPDDAALFGCDGIEDAEYLPIPISTIAQPFEAMGETAWQFLERRLAEPDAPPQRTVLQPSLIFRASSQS